MNMLKFKKNRSLCFPRPIIEVCLMAFAVFLAINARATVPGAVTNTVVAGSAKSHPAVLDSKRLFALGMIETGNNDREVGRAGEVSRYQILPVVWRNYSRSADYRNPQVSVQVAQRHWNCLANTCKDRTGR